jgi:hypothetical protein
MQGAEQARNGVEPMQFTVGFKFEGKVSHATVDGEDALAAALMLKAEQPDALVMYVRPRNRRGDARHPPLRSAAEVRLSR